MKRSDLLEMSSRLRKVMDDFMEWDITDQIAYVEALDSFYETMKPIINKYDPQKSFAFEIRRLDDLRRKGDK